MYIGLLLTPAVRFSRSCKSSKHPGDSGCSNTAKIIIQFAASSLIQILKDIRNRFEMLRGRQVHYVPGWDCHGLPIELKALGESGTSDLGPLQIRQKGTDGQKAGWTRGLLDLQLL